MTYSWLALPLLLQPLSAAGEDGNWPGFRGPRANGVAEGYGTPTEWSVPEDKNIAWKTPVPGLAHSSPAVWEGHLYVTTAAKVEGEAELSSLFGSPGYGSGDSVENEGAHDYKLYCLDKHSGEILWERTAHSGPPAIKRHPKSSHANPTPACDADNVVAFFGSEGLYCFSHDGELKWKRDLGVLNAGAPGYPDTDHYQWGYASSPVIHDGLVLVQCDVQDQSFVAALALETGEDVWRTDRDEDPTWSTPTVIDAGAGGKPQVALNGYKHIGGYDLQTGEEVWKLVGGGDVPVPTPVVAQGKIFITSAHGRMAPIYAIETSAEGLLTKDAEECEHMAWSHDRRGIYMQTPIVYGGELYCCSDAGILTCYDIETGESLYRERLGTGKTGFSGSAVAAAGKLYFSGENGEVFVVQAGRQFTLLATNDLGETCMSTPAISEGALYFRTRHHVVAVAEQ